MQEFRKKEKKQIELSSQLDYIRVVNSPSLDLSSNQYEMSLESKLDNICLNGKSSYK